MKEIDYDILTTSITDKIVKQLADESEKRAFDNAKLEGAITKWTTVLFCSKITKIELTKVLHGYPIVILASTAVPDGEIYEIKDEELKRKIIFNNFKIDPINYQPEFNKDDCEYGKEIKYGDTSVYRPSDYCSFAK